MSPTFSVQCFCLSLLTLSAFVTATIPSDLLRRRASETAATSVPKDFETFYYTQRLDHFNYKPESYTSFKQRYVINYKYWGGTSSGAPIFVYLGAEAPIDGDLTGIGFLNDNAAQFKALVLYIEHRYYGESVPSGSFLKAYEDANLRGYFNSAQALADYAEIILYLKDILEAHYSPVIVIGVSYGGMLASWFRLKYPHVALGALASSAPVLYFDNMTLPDGFFDVVSKDFREASETCYKTILNSWAEIDSVASQPNGLAVLSKRFQTCSPLKDPSDLVLYLEAKYVAAAKYDYPPGYPVSGVCKAIDGASYGNDILSKIFAGVVTLSKIFPDAANVSCYVNPPANPTETDLGWNWQTCSEIVFPIGIGNKTMFPPSPFDLQTYMEQCNSTYGVLPKPHWITAYYGGHNIKLVLERFGSNIIFSNGLRDPFSIGGVLQNISDTILAIYTTEGAHGLDVLPAAATDPQWLVAQRKAEAEIIKGWIDKFYADVQAFLH